MYYVESGVVNPYPKKCTKTLFDIKGQNELLPSIGVSSKPPGAEIYIVGKLLVDDPMLPESEQTPILTPVQTNIEPGQHSMSVMVPDYKPSTEQIDVPPYSTEPDANNTMVIETFVLSPKDPSSVSTTADTQITVGETATDTATVNGVGGITPTGKVTFKLFGPSTSADCNSPAIYESTIDLISGSATSDPFTTATLGTYYWMATYSGDDTYLTSTTICNDPSETLVVNKATPTITWSNPADITYGAALSDAQLGATASVPGSIVYTPASGFVLNAGNGQTLYVEFMPEDTTNYQVHIHGIW